MAEPRKMVLRDAIALYDALPILDGYPDPAAPTPPPPGPNEQPKPVKLIPWKLGKDGKRGKVVWNLTTNRDHLEDVVKRFKRKRDEIINDVSGGTGVIQPNIPENDPALSKAENDAKVAAAQTEYNAKIGEINKRTADLLDTEIEVRLLPITVDDLQLDDNPGLTPTMLALLSPIIVETAA